MRGITSWATYLPHWRLDRSDISAFVGQGGGRGTRAVASYDEDPVTLGVAAARQIVARHRGATVDGTLWFATTAPPYTDKTNATAVHAALRLDDGVGAFDVGASARSAMGALVAVLRGGTDPALLVAADVRTGLAGSADEANSGDAGVAVLIGDDTADAPVAAELVATATATAEFVDRWRTPGEQRTKTWDDKFASVTYSPLVDDAWKRALADAGLTADDIAVAAVAAANPRLASTLAGRLGVKQVAPDHVATVGIVGGAQPALMLVSALEAAEPGQHVAVVNAHDGADVIILRTTDAVADARCGSPVTDQAASGHQLPYGKFLSWRGMLEVEPPRRPEPQRVSASAAARASDWKFGFIGSRDTDSGAVHLPPSRVSADGKRTDRMEPATMADAVGTVATFTIDRVAYSPSPPVIFAVVDFDGGGRLPIELCDVDTEAVEIGMRVEMTFRRLYTADGIHNYFWKARPVSEGEAAK